MTYHVIGHDFTVGVDNTPAVLKFDEYTKDRHGCGDWWVDSYNDLEDATNALFTTFELEKWVTEDEGCDSYQVYGCYCTVESIDGKVLATSKKVDLDGSTIDRWKSEIEERIEKGEENKFFYFDDPHYTYCPDQEEWIGVSHA